MLRYSYRIWSKIVDTKSRYIFRYVTSPEASKQLFLTIPEIADDKKPLNINNFLSLSPHDIFIEVSRSIQNFDSNLTEISEKLLSYCNNENYNFDNTIMEITKNLEEIDSYFKFLKVISYSSDDLITKYIAYNLFNKIHIASQQILNITKLDLILSKLLKNELNEVQRKTVEMMKANFEVFGRYLSKDKISRMSYSINVLLIHQMRFKTSVNNSKSKLLQYVDRSDLSDDTPQWLLSHLKVSGFDDKYKVDITTSSAIQNFLKYCNNPLVRNQIWLSTRQIGGKILFNFKSSNYKNIMEIRNIRKNIANIFGEDNYSNFIFKNKLRMANSLDDVMHVLEFYKNRTLPTAEIEFQNLNEFAMKKKGLKEFLMPWDIDNIQHCYSLEVLKCPWSKLEIDDTQFNLHTVLERIFSVLYKMFNIKFENKYIQEHEIGFSLSTNNYEGEIVFKINKNSRKKPVEVLPMKSKDENSITKVSYVVINLPLDTPNLFDCLEIIGNLGTILNYHLCSNDIDISPLHTSLPPDAIKISSKFLLHSFLSSPHIFQHIFPELGQQVAQDLTESYGTKGINMFSNISNLEALYMAYFDIEMYLSDKSWQNIQMELWHDFFGSSSESKLYFPFQKMDEWPCSATDIFSDHVWGGMKKYSLFWTDNVVNILFKQFVTANFNVWNPNEDMNPELINLFKQFRKTFIEERDSIRQFPLS